MESQRQIRRYLYLNILIVLSWFGFVYYLINSNLSLRPVDLVILAIPLVIALSLLRLKWVPIVKAQTDPEEWKKRRREQLLVMAVLIPPAAFSLYALFTDDVGLLNLGVVLFVLGAIGMLVIALNAIRRNRKESWHINRALTGRTNSPHQPST